MDRVVEHVLELALVDQALLLGALYFGASQENILPGVEFERFDVFECFGLTVSQIKQIHTVHDLFVSLF